MIEQLPNHDCKDFRDFFTTRNPNPIPHKQKKVINAYTINKAEAHQSSLSLHCAQTH